MANQVNKLNMGNNGTSFAFNGGVCDCLIVKIPGNATGVTCNGNPFIKFAQIIDTAGTYHQVWGLQDAPQGLNTIAFTGGSFSSSVESYAGISTTATFPNTSGTAEHHLGSGALDLIQVDVVTTEDDCILVGLGGYQGPILTSMFAGDATTTISEEGPGINLSFESTPLTTGVAGTYHLQGRTGGGSVGIIISLIVVALTPGPLPTVAFVPHGIII